LSGDACIDEGGGKSFFEVVLSDGDLVFDQMRLEQDGVDPFLLVPAGGEDEEMTGFEVADGINADGLETRLIDCGVAEDLLNDVALG
jgi:hypothetical protein